MKHNEKCNALIYTLEIYMMANLELYLQIHIRALYSYMHASLLILYLHSIRVIEFKHFHSRKYI